MLVFLRPTAQITLSSWFFITGCFILSSTLQSLSVTLDITEMVKFSKQLKNLEWEDVSYGWHTVWRTRLEAWYLYLGHVFDENGYYDSMVCNNPKMASGDNYVQLVWFTTVEVDSAPLVEKGVQLARAKEMGLGEILEYLGMKHIFANW